MILVSLIIIGLVYCNKENKKINALREENERGE
jgi:hypothetical protein